uniref:Ig-like domain-containing protein n=1 Tax=Monodelphis domestica TaxID=13616 RepID=A0A5F8H740_MONDO
MCEMVNIVSHVNSDGFILDVAYGPDSMTILPAADRYNVGEHIQLTCSAQSCNPPAQLTWLQNGQPVSNSGTFSATAALNHAGNYTCVAYNSLTGIRHSQSMNIIIYGPLSKPIILTSNNTAVETKNFSMTCQPSGAIVTTRWFINGLPAGGNRIQLSPDKSILTIHNLSRTENKGPYECETENTVSVNKSDPFTLDVTYGPDNATIAHLSNVYPTGANIIFNCSADSHPPVQFTWLHHGQQIRNSPIFSIIASVGDAGTYTCTASNSLTGLTRTASKTLRIYAPLSKPTILISNKTAVETKDFSMTCQATGQIEAYQWFINGLAPVGSRIQLSQDKRILTLPRLTRRDNQGPYVCGIENPLFSSMSDPFTVNVTYGPDNATIVRTPDVYPTGANIIFNCSADSNPPAQLIWLRNGQQIRNSSIFSIIASLSDAGTYTCSASNSLTGLTRTSNKTIRIYAPLSKPTILISNKTAVETKDFSMTCQATGQIEAYQWFINGLAPVGSRIQLSRDTRILTLPRLTRRDNQGPYVCGIENALFSSMSDPFILDVTYGPDIATIVHTPDVYPTGANIIFNCSADSNPPAQFIWLQNGQRVSNSATFSIIASLSDAGTYTCTASNSLTGLTRTATKNITIYAPLSKPTIVTSNITAVETKDFSLTCQATGQIHTYQWFINGVAPAGSRIQLSPDKRTLTLSRLTRRDNKVPYECEIRNPFYSNRSDPFTLDVAYGPDIATIDHISDQFATGINVTLSCVADSNPPAQFTWLQNGQSVNNSASFSIITSLNHIGNYTCIATNSFTGLTRTANKTLMIYAPLPKPIIVTSNNTAVETKDFSLTCNATGQIHTYRWFINGLAPGGNRIQLSQDKRILTIRSLTRRENKGPYVCEIENPFFMDSSDPFKLNVTYGPDNATIVHTVNEYPVGANITLSCSANSNPAAQFTWLQNGQSVSNSATFSFIATLNHAGTYTCSASNSFTGLTRTATKNLIIYAPLSKPTILTSNITAVETKDFSFTCQGIGQIHAYWWLINGVAPAGGRIQLSPDKRTLTIRSLTRRENKGPYVCGIENPLFSNRSDPFTLDVAYGPDIATIVHTPDVYPTGANITLSCSATSNPPVQFTWLQNGQPVSNSATFSFIASLNHAGTYTCTASNAFTGLTRNATKNLIIYAPLSKPTIVTSNITAVETKDFSMTCQATGQIHAYRWFINGVAPAGSRIQLSPDKKILTIPNLTRRDNKGPYVCEIENPLFSNRSDPFTLDVAYGPDIAMIVRTQDVYPTGANITLSCSAISNPPVQFTWLQNGQPVSNSATFSFIASLNRAGTYTCIASNSFTGLAHTANKTLIIYAPLSKPTILTSNRTAVETKDFSLTCQGTGQIHAYRWFINGLAPSGSRIQLSPDKKILTIGNLTRRENKGPYVCEIENPLFRNRSDPFTLNVTYGPDIATIAHSVDEYPIGANITLSCSAVSNPPVQFTWLHNGQPVSNSATFSFIASMTLSGTYTCNAANSLTGLTRSATKNVIIYAPLSKPTIVTSNITAVETKDFSFTCQATGQIHTYRWFINGLAPSGSRIQLSPDKRTLTIRNLIRTENKGPYECEIQNPFYSNRSDPFTLDVAYGPDTATIVRTVDEYPIGANITLSCSSKPNPPVQFTWLHNGQPVSNSATFSFTASLSLAGTYTCSAANSFTGLTRTATKNVIIYAPLSTPIIVTSNNTAVETKDFSFTCQATGQIHTYRWFINGRAPAGSRIQLSPDKRTLTIRNLTRTENKGPYVCEIKNPFYSNRSDPFTLDVAYGPDTATIVRTVDEYLLGNIT